MKSMTPTEVVAALSDTPPDAPDKELSAAEAQQVEVLARQLSTLIVLKQEDAK